MHKLTDEDQKLLLKMFNIDKNSFESLKKSNQNKIVNILLILHEYNSFSNEFPSNEWDAEKIRTGLKMLRSCKRRICEYKKIKSEISDDLNHFEEYTISEIEELKDLYQEVIAKNSKQEVQVNHADSEESLGDIIGDFFSNLFDGLKWVLIILIIFIVLFLILAPTHIYPLIGNCNTNEDIFECYFRIQIEKKNLEEFTECQDACGRGVGNELCLEKCEYQYGMNKYDYTP
ncbi:hypothetical protein K9K83_00035 [Candidatus Woesearchaeota archaeon]|nr:hypothetical protein [Candidatus Woesearchaeota archaeon]